MPADRLSGTRTLNGRYRLVEPLGSGGMGTVWVAHDEVLGRDVAVKELVLPPSADPSQREELLQRALREARTAAQIDHPNVVRVFDVVEHDDRPWIVMELVRARSLAQRLRESGPLPPAEAAHVGLELLKGLDAAHRAGVVHRDVKPGNVLLGDDGRVLLTDFGVSAREGDSTLTRTGMLVGSPAYISPERARGHAVPASDLWALGATLFAAVEGRSPFERAEPIAALTAALTEPAPQAEHAGPALQAAIDRLLDKDPEQRADVNGARALLERAAVTGPARSTAPTIPGDLGDSTLVLDVPASAEEARAAREEAQRSRPAREAGALGAAGAAAGAAGAAAAGAGAAGAAPAEAGAEAGVRPEAAGESAAAAGASGAAGAGRAPDAGARETRPRGEGAAGSARPTPSRRGGGPRGGVLVALTVALVVLVGAAAVAILSGRDPGGRGSATGPTGTSGSATPPPSTGPSSPAPSSPAPSSPAPSSPAPSSPASSPAPSTPPPSSPAPSPTSPSSGSSGSSAAVPAGYTRYTDPTGFSVAVPDGWTPKHHDGVVDLQDPKGSRYLRIGQTDSPKPDPVADWKNQEQSVSKRLPGYQRIRIDPVDYRGWKAADWEFTFRPSSGSTIHVLDRGFVTGPKGYALYMSAPDGSWSDAMHVFDVAAATFTPAG